MGRRSIVLIVALLLAGLAAFSIWRVLSEAQTSAREGTTLVEVYRAQSFIAEGTDGALVISSALAIASEENLDFLPENAITSEDQLRAVLTGRVAAGPISANSVLTSDSWVAITEEIRPLSEVIGQNRQAMTILAPAERGVNGFIQPGDSVNVIVTTSLRVFGESAVDAGFDELTEEDQAAEAQADEATTPQEKTLQFTRFVMQGVPVLAVGREIVPDEDAPVQITADFVDPDAAVVEESEDQTTSLITLEVTPDQAERLAFSYETGSVWLTLVPADFTPARTEGVIFENLFQDFGILTTLFPDLEALEALLGAGG